MSLELWFLLILEKYHLKITKEMYYAIEMNGAFVKEYKSLKKALNWVFQQSKLRRNKEYPDCLTIWRIQNHQRECVLTNAL